MTKYPDPTPIYVVVIVLLFYEGGNVYCNSINLKKTQNTLRKFAIAIILKKKIALNLQKYRFNSTRAYIIPSYHLIKEPWLYDMHILFHVNNMFICSTNKAIIRTYTRN